MLYTVTKAYVNLTTGFSERIANRLSDVLARSIGTEFRITLAANALVKEKKDRAEEVNGIKAKFIVSVELEHQDVDVGPPIRKEYPSSIFIISYHFLFFF